MNVVSRSAHVLLSATLTYLSFPNAFSLEGSPGLAWGSLILLFSSLDGRSLKERMALGAVWSFFVFCLLVRWVLPINTGAFLLFAAMLSFAPLLFSALFRVSSESSWFCLFWWPSVWAFSEWSRSLLMGGFAWSFAYSQAAHPDVVQAASFGGSYAVVWILVFVNSAIYLAFKHKKQRILFFSIAIFVYGLNLYWGARSVHFEDDQATVRMALIQPNIEFNDKLDVSKYDENVARHLTLSKAASLRDAPEMIVWPETSFPDDVLRDPRWGTKMQLIAKNFKAYFLVGSALLHKGYDLNAALLLSPEQGWVEVYQKTRLIPFVELPPRGMLGRWLSSTIGLAGYHFKAGSVPGIFSLNDVYKKRAGLTVSIGVVICSEEAYPALFRSIVGQGAQVVVSLLNDGWFQYPEALMMHAQHAVFRAIETGRAVVRAANTGRTVVFDHRGRALLLPYPGLNEEGFVTADVPVSKRLTFYVRYGDIFVGTCAVFVIIILGLRAYRKYCQCELR